MPNLSSWGERLNIGTNGERYELQVTALKNGTFVAVWSEYGTDFDIRAQIFMADGTAIGQDFQVNTSDVKYDGSNAPSTQRFPDVSALADGGFAVAWVDYTGGAMSGKDIRARAFNADGTGRGDDFIASKAFIGDQTSPHITSYGNGGGFIVSSRGFGLDQTIGVSNTVFDAAGNSTEFWLAGNFESHSASAIIDSPPGARYAGMFISAVLDADKREIKVNAISNNGSADGWTIGTENKPSGVYVTALSGGRFIITWKQT
ncbi:hypothetical protein [Microvirga soli]|uniref:hypothetical protein n=1 Tax=Microvirga soli TaxID=1854496 RepID=UPI00191F5C3B|nr:hypothetical protein [Microvirga soli]